MIPLFHPRFELIRIEGLVRDGGELGGGGQGRRRRRSGCLYKGGQTCAWRLFRLLDLACFSLTCFDFWLPFLGAKQHSWSPRIGVSWLCIIFQVFYADRTLNRSGQGCGTERQDTTTRIGVASARLDHLFFVTPRDARVFISWWPTGCLPALGCCCLIRPRLLLYSLSSVAAVFSVLSFFAVATPACLWASRTQAFLEALLVAERGKVCAQVVSVPTGMQALVDLLDDR